MPTLRVPYDQTEKVKELLKRNLKERKVRNALFSFEGGGVYITLYPSGILLVQGKNSEDWIYKVLEIIDPPEGPVAGCDEAGKGDIFGPLVLCCAVIDPENFKEVLKATPKDTKSMEDEEVLRKAEKLKKLVKVRCVKLMPERFNVLYGEFGNLNRLMDSAYGKLIEVIRYEFKPIRITLDAYSKVSPFQGVRFLEKGEREVEVSVASIIARGKFLRSLRTLSVDAGVNLPKGAGPEARSLASRIREEDPDLARRVMKIY